MQGQKRLAIWIALALSLIHLSLALAYGSIAPYLQPGYTNEQLLPDIGAPDEYSHIAYVDYLIRKREFPVLRPGTKEAELMYEAHQPPLYYLLAAGWFSFFGSDVVPGPGLGLRSMNALFGAGIVLGGFFLALWATGRERTALLTAAIIALLPMLGFLDGMASNDPLIILISTWALALMVKWRGDWTIGRSLAAGALVGAAILTKSSGLLLLPPLLLAIWLGGGARLVITASAGLGAIAVGGPWLVRNYSVYGDLLGMSAFYAYFPRGVWPSQVFSGLRPFARWLYVLSFGTALSTVGIFGYMDIHLRYRHYIPILALISAGLIGAAWWRLRIAKREGAELDRRIAWPLGLFVVMVVAGHISYNLWQVQPQARYLFPAIAPLGLWIVVGLERIGRRTPVLLPLVLCVLLAIANVSALRILPGEYERRVEAAKELGGVSPLRASPAPKVQ